MPLMQRKALLAVRIRIFESRDKPDEIVEEHVVTIAHNDLNFLKAAHVQKQLRQALDELLQIDAGLLKKASESFSFSFGDARYELSE